MLATQFRQMLDPTSFKCKYQKELIPFIGKLQPKNYSKALE